MAERKLRPVGPDEKPEKAEKPAPKTLAEAAECSRRELLVMARRRIAEELDNGAPAHTVGRLVSELERLDTQVRQLIEREAEEARQDAEETADDEWQAV